MDTLTPQWDGNLRIEDEFLFAEKTGDRVPFYVWRSPEDRDPRLSAMIKKIEGGPYTISFMMILNTRDRS